MKPFAFLWFFLGLSLVPPKAFGFRILVAQERKGELRGHLDKNPPIPIYGPDTIDLSYVDQGRLVTIRDRSGALTLAISVDATQHILKSDRTEMVRIKYRGNPPATIQKSLEMLKAKYGSNNTHPQSVEVQTRISETEKALHKSGPLSEDFVKRANSLLELVGKEEEYSSSGEQPLGAQMYYERIRGSGFESKPEVFIFDLQPAVGGPRPTGNRESTSQ